MGKGCPICDPTKKRLRKLLAEEEQRIDAAFDAEMQQRLDHGGPDLRGGHVISGILINVLLDRLIESDPNPKRIMEAFAAAVEERIVMVNEDMDLARIPTKGLPVA